MSPVCKEAEDPGKVHFESEGSLLAEFPPLLGNSVCFF